MQKRKPNSREKHKFEAERARRILNLCFPQKYEQSLLSESPDIINPALGIGVEVTNSLKSIIHEGIARASDITGKTENELSKVNKTNIASGRVTSQILPNGQLIGAFTTWGNIHIVEQMYKKKREKLNSSHFQKLQENNLFIYAWFINSSELESAVKYLVTSGELLVKGSNKDRSAVCFDRVYILTGDSLIEIVVKEHQDKRYCIDPARLHEISNSAFKEVFGVSREEYYGTSKF